MPSTCWGSRGVVIRSLKALAIEAHTASGQSMDRSFAHMEADSKTCRRTNESQGRVR